MSNATYWHWWPDWQELHCGGSDNCQAWVQSAPQGKDSFEEAIRVLEFKLQVTHHQGLQMTHHIFCNKIIEIESIQRPWNNCACNVTADGDGCYKRVSVPSHKNIPKNFILPRHCSTITPCISVLFFACFINTDKLQAITLEISMQRLSPVFLEDLITFNCQFVKIFLG
jgi:hypothetical protein